MSAEKTKEDELFFDFLENNPGAMQLYNMVLQKQEINATKTGKSPCKSVGAHISMVPLKSPAKASHNVLPPGKSPRKSPRKSVSTTNVFGKSPAKHQHPIIPIGKSPKKSVSVSNVRAPNPNRKSWVKIEPDFRSNADKSENSESANYVPQLNSFSTPARKERKLPILNDMTTSSDVGNANYDVPATVQNRTYASASNSRETPVSLPRSQEELKNQPENTQVKSKKWKDPQTKKKKSKRDSKDPEKKKKITKKKKDVDSEDEAGPPPPCHVPPPPPVDILEVQVIDPASPHIDPYSIFTKVVNLSSGLDISTKDWHLRTYKHSFVANSLVDWITENGLCKTREIATEYGVEMQKLGFIESASKSTTFKDAKLLFQLSSKGKLIRSEQASVYFGQVFDPRNGVEIKDRAWHLKKYKACFLGEEFVSWFITNNVVLDRNRAVRIGREFFENHLIEHVSQEHHFKDGPFLYHLTREGVIRRMQTYSVSSKNSIAMKSSERSNSESKQTDQLEDKDTGESIEEICIDGDPMNMKTSLDVSSQKPSQQPETRESKTNSTVLKLDPSEITSAKSKLKKDLKRVEEEKFMSDSDSEGLPPVKKTNRNSRRFSASLGSATVSSLNATEFFNSRIKSNGPLVPIHRAKGPSNRRLPTKFVGTNSQNTSKEQTNPSSTIPVAVRVQSTRVESIRSPVSETKNQERTKLNTEISLALEKKLKKDTDSPIVPQAVEYQRQENSIENNATKTSPSGQFFSLEDLLREKSGMKSFRQYLVKNCKFQELDFIDFLNEVFCIGRETNVRQRTLRIREVYKTHISDSSPTYLPLPKAIIDKIQSMIDSRSISENIYNESSRYIQEQLTQVVNNYINSPFYGSLQSEKAAKTPEKISAPVDDSTEKIFNEKSLNTKEEQIKEPVSKVESRDAFLHNLDFCYAVSTFKVNYLTKTETARTEEALSIVSKFLNAEKPSISVSNNANLAQALKSIKLGIFKIDVFDKLLSDVAEVLNSSSKPNTAFETSKTDSVPVTQPSGTLKLGTSKVDVPVKDMISATIIPVENTASFAENPLTKETTTPGKAWRPRNKVVKDTVLSSKAQENITSESVICPEKSLKTTAVSAGDSLVWVRVTDRDPKTNLVTGRVWRQHYYRLNPEGSKLCCYLSGKSTPIEELCIDFSKLNSVKDIAESEQLSEPENCRFACSISVLRLIFACSSVEERSAWITTVREKLVTYQTKKDVKVTTPPIPVEVVIQSDPVDKTLLSLNDNNTETVKTERFSIILRRFNKRGGVRIPIPDSIDELLSTASEKLKIAAVRIREVDTEAEITEISLFRPDMLVWIMTSEEEQEFV